MRQIRFFRFLGRPFARVALFALAMGLAGVSAVARTGASHDGSTATDQSPLDVTVVSLAHWGPQYTIGPDGQPTGFAIDLIREVARRANLNLRFRFAESWSHALAMLQSGEADLIPNLGMTPERVQRLAFARPLETFRISIFVREATPDIDDIADLVGRLVAVDRDNAAAELLAGYDDLSLLQYDNFEVALLALLSGQVDALAFPEPLVRAFAERVGVDHRIRMLRPPLAEIKRSIAVRADNTRLLARLDRALEGFVGSPAYREIYTRWYRRKPPLWARQEFWWSAAGILALLLGAGLVWHYVQMLRLNRQLVLVGEEREATMRALRESETRYRTLIENSSLAISIAARDGTRLFVNRAYAALLGYASPEELMALPSAPVSHLVVAPHDRARVAAYRKAAFEGRWFPPSYEFDALRKDGSIVPVQAFIQRITWDGTDALERIFIDLSERKRAENALRESESRFRYIFESGGTGMLLRLLDGTIVEANKAFADFVGYSPRELIGRSILDFALPEDVEQIHERMARYARGEDDGATVERQFRHADGSTRWAMVNSAVARGPGGEPCYVVTTVRDINERKLAEQALAESERRHREMMEQFPLAIQIFDMEGRRLFINQAFVDLLGYDSPAEALMAPRGRFVAPEHCDGVREHLTGLLRGETDSGSGELTLIRRDGTRVPVQTFERRIVWAGRAAIQRTYVDLTERKRAEMALRTSEERFRTVFEAGGAGMTICDMSGRYLQVNRAFCELVAYPAEELLRLSVADLCHPDDRAGLTERIASLRAGQASQMYERRYVRKDGTTVWCIVCIVIVRDGTTGEPYQIGIFQDITERKRAEQALAESRERLLNAQRIARLGDWERDFATDRIHWSDEVYRICGIPREGDGVTFRTFLETLVHPEDRDDVRDAVRRSLSTGQPYSLDHRIVRPNGEIRFLHEEGEVALDAEGKPLRFRGTVQDVTELRQAQAALEASEARFRGVFEAGGAGIVLSDQAGTVLEVNRAFAAFVGYSEAELLGKPIPTLFFAEDAALAATQRQALFDGRIDRLEVERRFIRKDGAIAWASVSATAMRDAPGRSQMLVWIVQDVTERKRSEQALAQKTALLDLSQALATTANRAPSFAEAVEDCLHRICAFTGWPVGHAFVRSELDPDVLQPMLVWHLADPERFEPLRSATERMVLRVGMGVPGHVVATGEVEWRTRIPIDPAQQTLRSEALSRTGLKSGFAAPVMSGDRVVAVLEFYSTETVPRDEGIVEVIRQAGTELGRLYERERAETGLRRREEQLRQIIDNVPHWIFVRDREGRHLLANRALASAYGLTIDEVIGRSHMDIFSDKELAARVLAGDRDVIASGEMLVIREAVFPTPDGIRRLRITKMPYTTQSGEIAVLGIAEDITDQLRVEEERRRAQRMDALGKMTGGVAHDFNNLLTIILGNLQLLERRLNDEQLRGLAETAERAAQRGAEVTRRLLAFARSQPLEPRPIDMNALVHDTMALTERSLGPDVAVETVLAPDLWQTRADPSQVENALINLIVNARDAMPGGGRVVIETSNVTVDDRSQRIGDLRPGEYVMLAVSDTGTGMSAEVAARAFEPFFTTKEVGKGNGLGLSMVYGFVRQSGGDVVIRSQPGEGTTVMLLLPRSDAGACPQETLPPAAPRGARETVLLVEHDPDVRTIARTALETLGYRVFEAVDAASALAVIESNPAIDVLFSDLSLSGGMDGIALAKAARQRVSGLRVILTSGNPDLLDRPVGDSGILQKPYTQTELAAVLQAELERSRSVRV